MGCLPSSSFGPSSPLTISSIDDVNKYILVHSVSIMKMTNIKLSFLFLLLLLLLLPQVLLRPALKADTLNLQDPVFAMMILKLGDKLLNNVEQTLGMH